MSLVEIEVNPVDHPTFMAAINAADAAGADIARARPGFYAGGNLDPVHHDVNPEKWITFMAKGCPDSVTVGPVVNRKCRRVRMMNVQSASATPAVATRNLPIFARAQTNGLVVNGMTGGTLTLTFTGYDTAPIAGQTTAAIPYNATALQVQTALRNLAAVDTADVECTGGPLNTAGVTIEWSTSNANAGQYNGRHVGLTLDGSGLTGGGTATLSKSNFPTTGAGITITPNVAGRPWPRVRILDPQANSQVENLQVVVRGRDVSVEGLGTGSTGLVTTTAAAVVAAINANPEAAALVTASIRTGYSGTGTIQGGLPWREILSSGGITQVIDTDARDVEFVGVRFTNGSNISIRQGAKRVRVMNCHFPQASFVLSFSASSNAERYVEDVVFGWNRVLNGYDSDCIGPRPCNFDVFTMHDNLFEIGVDPEESSRHVDTFQPIFGGRELRVLRNRMPDQEGQVVFVTNFVWQGGLIENNVFTQQASAAQPGLTSQWGGLRCFIIRHNLWAQGSCLWSDGLGTQHLPKGLILYNNLANRWSRETGVVMIRGYNFVNQLGTGFTLNELETQEWPTFVSPGRPDWDYHFADDTQPGIGAGADFMDLGIPATDIDWNPRDPAGPYDVGPYVASVEPPPPPPMSPMVVTQLLTNGGEHFAGNAASYTTTGSIDPIDDSLMLVAVSSSAASTPPVPTLTGAGRTWEFVGSAIRGAQNMRITLFRSLGSGSAGQLTADFAGATQTSCCILPTQIENTVLGDNGAAALGTPGVGNGLSTGGAGVTLATFADPDEDIAFVAGVYNAQDATLAVEAGFTPLAEIAGEVRQYIVGYRVGQDTSPSLTWTGTRQWAIVAVEVKQG